MFYKAIVQSDLLFGAETWTVTKAMLEILKSFHHRVARRLSGMMPHRAEDGTWTYPPLQEAMEKASLWPMREYVRRRQATVEDYIATRPIYNLCIAADAEPLPGSTSRLRWWNQDHNEERPQDQQQDNGEQEQQDPPSRSEEST